MYCPKCKSEYLEGIEVCKDCNERLVKELPNHSNDGSLEAIKPVKLTSVSNNVEAGILLELLHQNHIPCFKKDKGSGGYMNLYMGYSIFGSDIYVDEEDYEAAEGLLNYLNESGDLNSDMDGIIYKESNEESEMESISKEEQDTSSSEVVFYKKPAVLARIIIVVTILTVLFSAIINSIT